MRPRSSWPWPCPIATCTVEVANPGGGFEPRPSGPEDSDSGWGLFLVDRLSDDWGVAQDPGSGYQRVWFAIARA